MSSESACQELRAKLQAALRGGVEMLETVQTLELDKAALEGQLGAVKEQLSGLVSPCESFSFSLLLCR